MQVIEVANLHGEAGDGHAVLAHARVDRAHLRLQLGEDGHDVLQQLRAVVGFDFDVDRVRRDRRRRSTATAGCVPAWRSCRRRSDSRRDAR